MSYGGFIMILLFLVEFLYGSCQQHNYGQRSLKFQLINSLKIYIENQRCVTEKWNRTKNQKNTNEQENHRCVSLSIIYTQVQAKWKNKKILS